MKLCRFLGWLWSSFSLALLRLTPPVFGDPRVLELQTETAGAILNLGTIANVHGLHRIFFLPETKSQVSVSL